jgi:hypothetical protein
MIENLRKANEGEVRDLAERHGLNLRRDDGGRFSLLDNQTVEVAFENSAANRTLDELNGMLSEAGRFDLNRATYGLGKTLLTSLDDEHWTASGLLTCLVADHFERALVPASRNREFVVIDEDKLDRWHEQALRIFTLRELFMDERELTGAVHFDSRLLAGRSNPNDRETAQGFTVIEMPD